MLPVPGYSFVTLISRDEVHVLSVPGNSFVTLISRDEVHVLPVPGYSFVTLIPETKCTCYRYLVTPL